MLQPSLLMLLRVAASLVTTVNLREKHFQAPSVLSVYTRPVVKSLIEIVKICRNAPPMDHATVGPHAAIKLAQQQTSTMNIAAAPV